MNQCGNRQKYSRQFEVKQSTLPLLLLSFRSYNVFLFFFAVVSMHGLVHYECWKVPLCISVHATDSVLNPLRNDIFFTNTTACIINAITPTSQTTNDNNDVVNSIRNTEYSISVYSEHTCAHMNRTNKATEFKTEGKGMHITHWFEFGFSIPFWLVHGFWFRLSYPSRMI